MTVCIVSNDTIDNIVKATDVLTVEDRWFMDIIIPGIKTDSEYRNEKLRQLGQALYSLNARAYHKSEEDPGTPMVTPTYQPHALYEPTMRVLDLAPAYSDIRWWLYNTNVSYFAASPVRSGVESLATELAVKLTESLGPEDGLMKALGNIQAVLNKESEWTSETLDRVAEIVESAGYPISNL